MITRPCWPSALEDDAVIHISVAKAEWPSYVSIALEPELWSPAGLGFLALYPPPTQDYLSFFLLDTSCKSFILLISYYAFF